MANQRPEIQDGGEAGTEEGGHGEQSELGALWCPELPLPFTPSF